MILPQAAYVHIPFCISKCWYCDFNSYPELEPIFDDYVGALIAEIETTLPSVLQKIEGESDVLTSVYFGGGTPTTLSARQLSAILDALRRTFGLSSDCEITVEANPGTVDEAELRALVEAGFNRLSLGVQSFDDDLLRSIGRTHTRDQALDAYANARRAGFSNIGIDLIFALPGQTVPHWHDTLETAMSIRPEHISLYELSIEEGTRFAEMRAAGRLAPVEEDARAEMYELAIAKLTAAAYEHYEVSNFALPGFRSRHNMTYWLNHPYYGFGAGATSYIYGTRARRVAHPRDYIAAVAKKGTVHAARASGQSVFSPGLIEFSETLEGRAHLGETMVLGLRMLDGIDLARVRAETSLDPIVEYADQITHLIHCGLLELTGTRLRVTHRGLLLLNDVAREFV